MKIGVLTLPIAYNYGGILQAYALQTVLLRLGHDVKNINYPFIRKDVSVFAKFKRIVKSLLGIYHGYICYETDFNRWLPSICKYTSKFISANIQQTKEIHSFDQLKESNFDMIVVGSDQIWRPCMFQYDAAIPFLNFAQKWNIKRISYAASFGTDKWEYDETKTKECAELAKFFDAVSVREESGVHLCNKYLGINAQFVLDPTLLLDKSDYESLVAKINQPKSEGNLFSYILDYSDDKQLLVQTIAKNRDLTPFSVSSFDGNIKCPLEDRIAKPVEAWLRAFMDAEYIVTDSFHACVFSIILRKPFVVVGNKGRGLSRFENLLGNLGLKDRMIEKSNDFCQVSNSIDYDSVYVKLSRLKKQSINFLTENL